MIELKIPFTNPENYVFDSKNVEVVDGEGKLKNRLPISNEIFFSTVWNSFNADRGIGGLSGAQTGGVIVNGEAVEFLGDSVKYIDYNDNNVLSLTKQGTIKVNIKFAYNQFPASDNTLFSISEDDGKNAIELTHKTTGQLNLKFISSDGLETIDIDLGLFSSDNTKFNDFELNFNFNDLGGGDGLTQLYLNGLLFGAFNQVISRTFLVEKIRVGSNFDGTSKSDFTIEYFQIFDVVQNTVNFTPEESPLFDFSKNDDLLTANAVALMDGLNSVSSDNDNGASGDIRFILTRGGLPVYWDGASWVSSDLTFSKGNTIAEINTGAPTFVSSQTSVGLIIVLKSNLGTATPTINDFIYNYNFSGFVPDTISKSLIIGNIIDGEGNGVNKPVKVFLSRDFAKYKANTTLNKSETAQTFTPRLSDGFFSINLIENDNMEPGTTWIFEYSDGNRESVTVKNLITQNFAQLERGYKSNI